MNEFWQESRDNGGVCGAANGESGSDRLTDIQKDYRWTPACQRAFLEALVCTGSVTRACREVEKSPRSAYDLRFRRQGAAFRIGWEAAILVGRAMLSDMLLDRAVCGYEEMTIKQDDGTLVRGKFDNRLSKGVLDRLDKMAEKQALAHSHEAQVQLVVQDFEAFLELIEKGGSGSDAALFCAARSADGGALIDPAEKQAIERELAQISAAEAQAEAQAKAAAEAIPNMFDEEPEVAAQRLGVWFDGINDQWCTNFPPPEDAAVAADAEDEDEDDENEDADWEDDLEQRGLFGDPGYQRKLTFEEEEAHIAVIVNARAPWRDAAAAARDAWFKMEAAV
jgi:hypothetical protein